VAGVGSGRRIGVLWLDAHADFTTPDTTTSGFLDGMGLSVLTGRCWRGPAAAVPGHRPVPDRAVILAGARDLSPGEDAALAGSAIARLTAAQLATGDLASAVERMAEVVDAVHLHVDLDVHDPSIAPANGYAAPGGPSAAQVRQVLRTVAARLPVSSAVLASYDPSYDRDDRMRDTALDLLATLADLLPGP
jgi:arginase